MAKTFVGKILSVMLIASLIGLPLFAQAQDKPLKKISWGVTSLSASNWIPWIAKDAKIYEKNGLDVELILVKGSGSNLDSNPRRESLRSAGGATDCDARGSRRGGSRQHRAYGAGCSEHIAG